MVSSIGPFWDANETWLVMAIGLLLVAFPVAHGVILTALYLPVAVLLIGLVLRGVSFEFRAKAPASRKRAWNWAFFAGSLMASLSQGFMLGMYIMGLTWTLWHVLFAMLTAVFLTVGFAFIGAAWLILKTEGELQRKAVGVGQNRHLGADPGDGGSVAGLAAGQRAHLRQMVFAAGVSLPVAVAGPVGRAGGLSVVEAAPVADEG